MTPAANRRCVGHHQKYESEAAVLFVTSQFISGKMRAAAELDGVVRRQLPPINKRLPLEAIGRRQRELMVR